MCCEDWLRQRVQGLSRSVAQSKCFTHAGSPVIITVIIHILLSYRLQIPLLFSVPKSVICKQHRRQMVEENIIKDEAFRDGFLEEERLQLLFPGETGRTWLASSLLLGSLVPNCCGRKGPWLV